LGQPSFDLPDPDVLLALHEPAGAAVLRDAMARTWAAVDGNHSPDGRARWLAAWRAWFDVLALRPGQRATAAIGHASLDFVERTAAAIGHVHPALSAGAN
jgi:metallophosphoesterase superfamily enzyme